MEEIWRPIPGFEGLYEVSNLGRVKSIGTYNTCKKGIMRPMIDTDGYSHVRLYNRGMSKDVSIHRLVAIAFIPNPEALPIINHKDENPANNNVENLEWCDDTYNKRYSQARRVIQYNIYGNQIKCWDTISDIEAALGFATTNICKCCKGQIKSSNGYIFLYSGDDIQKRLLEINNRKHKGKTERKLYELQ